MKHLLIVILLSIICFSTNAQYKIALYTPSNNSTKICPTLDSAYNSAQAGDYIYLPGGSFSLTKDFVISKLIHIIGAGIDPDSTLYSNPTIINSAYGTGSVIRIVTGADGGSLEGLNIDAKYIYFGSNASNQSVQNYTISRCYFQILYLSFDGSGIYPSNQSPQNITLTENVFSSMYPIGSNSSGINIYKNIIDGVIVECINAIIKNNIFYIHFPACWSNTPNINGNNVTYENNIFLNSLCSFNALYTTGNIINNNLFANCYPIFGSSTIQRNNITMQVDSIFVKYTSGGFLYTNDYHLSSYSKGKNAGSDGTDLGIYGSFQPAKEGWVPSNPHISLKQVDLKTNANGVLNATFKVLPQSN